MKYVIGVDVGGTKIDCRLFDKDFNTVRLIRRLTEAKKGRKKVLQNIIEVIKELDRGDVAGVGIAVPGYEQANKRLTDIHNVPSLMNFNLRNFLSKKLKKLVVIENDANCFALAEQRLGAAKGSKNVVGVILGTGVGAGVIINSELYRGSDGGAGEIGHTIIDSKGIMCTCGKVGDFESWCAGPNIVRHYKLLGGKMKKPDPKKIFYSKDKAAKAVMAQTYEKLGIGLGNVVNTLNPEVIVLGGGVSNLPFYHEIRLAVRKWAYPHLSKKVKIIKNRLGDSSGAIGAAVLAVERSYSKSSSSSS